MRIQRMLSIVSACTLPLIAAVCGEPGAPRAAASAPTVATVTPPEFAITDSRDDAGIAHFFFLEPVDRRPKGKSLGPADRSLESYLSLEICQWLGDHCAQPLLARYTKTSGVGKERLQLDDDDDYYKVRWYTSKFPSIDAGETYRLTVLAAGVPLGSADVKIVKKNKEVKQLEKSDFVGLRDDEGLTIRFYIERCGVYVLGAAGGSATPCVSGSVLATSSETVALIFPDGAVAPNTKVTVSPAADAPGDAGIAGGPFAFTPSAINLKQPVTLSMRYVPVRLPGSTAEVPLAAYELRDGAWRVAGPVTNDADHDRLNVDIAHVGQYAALTPVASISLVMPTAPLVVGAKATPKAVVVDALNRVLEHRQLDWSVFPAGVVSLDANGVLTALSAGEATVTVTSEGQRAAATITVGTPKPASVIVAGAATTPLPVGQTVQLSATARDANGTVVPGAVATWTTSSDAIASVDANGLVTARAPGDATISATMDGVVGSVKITVSPLPVTSVVVASAASGPFVIGSTRQLSATVWNGTTQLLDRAVTWSSSAPGVISVDATGLATAVSAGDATISATAETITGTLGLTAQLPPITSVDVTPAAATVLVGGVQQLTAVAMAGSSPQPGRAITWTSSNDAVASVDAHGLVTAKTPGGAIIHATVDGIGGASAITVNPVVVPVTSVVVSSPVVGPLDVGSTRALTAAVYNGSTQLFGRTVTWSSSNTNVMTVAGDGTVTAVSAGTATISAVADGVGGTSTLSTRAMIFGPYHIDQSLFNAPFTGALRELKPTDGIAMLDAARQAGFRLIITPVSGRSKFQDPVTGRFRLDLWKLQLDRFMSMDFRPYIADGTIIGIYLIDEPMDPTNWVNKNDCMTDGNTPTCLLDAQGDTIRDPGEPVSYADIDAAAAYAERYFPGVPMGVGSRPSQLLPGAPFQNLDFGLAQYTTNKKDSQGNLLTADQFVAYEVAAARQARLGLQLSINVIAGNSGAAVLPSQLRSWGTIMANEPYACALTMWKWDAADKGTALYNSYWTDLTNLAALRDVAAVAARHRPVPCRPQ